MNRNICAGYDLWDPRSDRNQDLKTTKNPAGLCQIHANKRCRVNWTNLFIDWQLGKDFIFNTKHWERSYNHREGKSELQWFQGEEQKQTNKKKTQWHKLLTVAVVALFTPEHIQNIQPCITVAAAPHIHTHPKIQEKRAVDVRASDRLKHHTVTPFPWVWQMRPSLGSAAGSYLWKNASIQTALQSHLSHCCTFPSSGGAGTHTHQNTNRNYLSHPRISRFPPSVANQPFLICPWHLVSDLFPLLVLLTSPLSPFTTPSCVQVQGCWQNCQFDSPLLKHTNTPTRSQLGSDMSCYVCEFLHTASRITLCQHGKVGPTARSENTGLGRSKTNKQKEDTFWTRNKNGFRCYCKHGEKYHHRLNWKGHPGCSTEETTLHIKLDGNLVSTKTFQMTTVLQC